MLRSVAIAGIVLASIPAAAATQDSASAGALMRLLKSGRLPKERQGPVVAMICQRGGAADLAYVFDKCVEPNGFAGDLRAKALDGLADAAVTRKIRPSGDLARLGSLFEAKDFNSRLAALRLAGLWKLNELRPNLEKAALDEANASALRQAALDGLVGLGEAAARGACERLANPGRPTASRFLGIGALARLDPAAAAPLAANAIADARGDVDSSAMLEAFLSRNDGADKLGAAFAKKSPPTEAARSVLRHLYAMGRSDPSLVDVLGKAAGLGAEMAPFSADEMKKFVAEVQTHGDAERGEMVFRRKELSCQKCHAIGKAGGNVGPDLAAIGVSSPVDYIVASIMLPDQAIKEAYLTKIIATADGRVLTGIVVDKNDRRIVLRDANGVEASIPTADVEAMKDGKSLMPKGLTKFMSRQDLADLVRFLSELGKPGKYAAPSPNLALRWRRLHRASKELLAAEPPAAGAFLHGVVEAPDGDWTPVFARTSGVLHLDETGSPAGKEPYYLSVEVDVSAAGTVGVQLDSADGLSLWLDDHDYAPIQRIATELTAGRHKLIVRVDPAKRTSKTVSAQFFKPEGSTAEFSVLNGK